MVYSMGKALAKSWKVKFQSEAYYDKVKEIRKRSSAFTISPCGPPCAVCGDNSYLCRCANET